MIYEKSPKTILLASIVCLLAIVVTVLGLNFGSAALASASGNGNNNRQSFSSLVSDRGVVQEQINIRHVADIAAQSASEKSPVGGASEHSSFATSPDTQAPTSPEVEIPLMVLQRNLYAVDLTRFFATKYGLEPDGPMPQELADLYDDHLAGNIDTDTYISTLERWLNRKPLWLN